MLKIYFKPWYNKPRLITIFLTEFKKIIKMARKVFNNRLVEFKAYIKFIEKGIINAIKYFYQ